MHAYTSCFSCQPAGSPGLGDDGARRSPSPLHFVILLTTRSRSVFWRRDNIETSRRRYKRELPSHTSVTNSGCFKMHARQGRSIHAGKVAGSRSASLPECVNHAEWGFFWSEKAENKGLSPLGLAPHSLNSSCVLLFFVPKRVCLRFGGLSSGSGETQKPHL